VYASVARGPTQQETQGFLLAIGFHTRLRRFKHCKNLHAFCVRRSEEHADRDSSR
jgi:hypothetical protein